MGLEVNFIDIQAKRDPEIQTDLDLHLSHCLYLLEDGIYWSRTGPGTKAQVLLYIQEVFAKTIY